MAQTIVCALYKFVTLDDYQEIKPRLLATMEQHDIRGTLLLAKEGINGTVSGLRAGIDALLAFLNSDPRLAGIEIKESYTDNQPFKRTKVKLKKEIVTMGVEGIDPKQVVGTYVDPKDWNDLISDPNVVLVDTRNDYEVQVGTFKNAVNPKTETFREFPDYVKKEMSPSQHKKVAMFCTGGIRCEKSTAYMKEQGFEEVYHLKGGILKYLEDVPKEESMWEGECFVFDDRVTVDHDLNRGHYDQCNACRLPITEEDKLDARFQKGVSCPYCFDKLTEEQKHRFSEREKQVQLAKARGETHIGGDVQKVMQSHREAKELERKRQQAINSRK